MSRRAGWVAVVGTIAVAVAGCGGSGPVQGPSPAQAPTQVPAEAPTQPVHPVASCPQGSEPDTPGPATQARPSFGEGGAFASMDTESGVVVVVDGDAGTWTFDVCTNTWAKQATKGSPPSEWPRLVYDAASDLTYAFGEDAVFTYDAESATWARVNSQDMVADGPTGHSWFFMDPERRTVYSYNTESGEMTSYDLARNRWAPVEQGTVRPPIGVDAVGAFDASVGRIVLKVSFAGATGEVGIDIPDTPSVYGQTWTFEPATGTWTKIDAYTPELNFGYFPWGGEVAYDTTHRKTVVFADSKLVTFDAATGVWTTAAHGKGWPAEAPPGPPLVIRHTDGPDELLTMTVGPLARHGHALVDDPVNGRVLMLGGQYRSGKDADNPWDEGTDVWAYDVDTNTWTIVVPPRPD